MFFEIVSIEIEDKTLKLRSEKKFIIGIIYYSIISKIETGYDNNSCKTITITTITNVVYTYRSETIDDSFYKKLIMWWGNNLL